MFDGCSCITADDMLVHAKQRQVAGH